MFELPDALCAQCRVISPHSGENQWGRITIAYNRVDQYPEFPVLESFAKEGCAFCGLLRHALQDKYSNDNIAQAENDFSPSIRANWSSGWNGRVTVDRAIFSTEEDWAERDQSQAPDPSLGSVHTLSLRVWPYPPRRSDCIPESSDLVWFAVYAHDGEWLTGAMPSSLTVARSRRISTGDFEAEKA